MTERTAVPVSDLRYVRAEAGDSYWSIRRDLNLPCSHTALWQANGRVPLDPGTIVFIPPWCYNAPEPTPEPEPEPEPHRMLLGASVQRRGTESWRSAVDRFEGSIGGRRLHALRRFIDGAPDINSSRIAADLTVSPPYEALVISFTHGTVAEMVEFFRALPANGTRYYVAIRHEPDKQLRMSGPAFRALCADLLTAARQVGRTDIVPTFVLMSWLERDGLTSTSSADYFPDEPAAWVMALDPYFPRVDNTYATQAGPTVALWRAYGGSRIALAEWGVKSTGAAAAAQVAQIITDAEADGCEFALYFDSNVGDNAGEGWYLDLRGPEALAVFGDAVAARTL